MNFILKGIFHVDTFVNADVIADFWQIIDNSETNQLTPIASGSVHSSKITVVNKMIWKNLMETYSGK